MKRTILKIFGTALIAGMTFSSCTRELSENEVPGGGVVPGVGDRVLEVSFAPSTKTVLDGFQPEFEEGDRIRVSNGVQYEDCFVTLVDSKPVIRTSVLGMLTAVYPPEAADMEGRKIIGIKVPAKQSGRFADANICMAEEVPEYATEMHFSNRTALLRFYVDASIGVESIMVTGAGNISTGGNAIIVDPDGDTLLSDPSVNDDPKHRLCYVAIPDGINANTLSLTSTTTTQGTVHRTMTSNVTLAMGKIYNAFIPYYIDLGAGGKWGYCNLGAFLPEDYGWHFSWGNTAGYVFKDSKWVNAEDGTVLEGGFTTDNYSPTDGSGLSTNIPVDARYDAAYAIWGPSWRMPTGGTAGTAEFTVLTKACRLGYSSGDFAHTPTSSVPTAQGVYYYNVAGGKGLYFVDAGGHKLFFPAAGAGDNADCTCMDANGFYWSGTLNNPSVAEKAYYFDFSPTKVFPQTTRDPRLGFSIRPVVNSGIRFEFYGDKNIKEVEYTVKDASTGTAVISGVRHSFGTGSTTAGLEVNVAPGIYNVELKVWSDPVENAGLNVSDWGGLYYKRFTSVSVPIGGNAVRRINSDPWTGVLMWYPAAGEEPLYWSTKNLGATNGDTKESWYGDWYPWAGCVPIYESVSWTGNAPNFTYKSSRPEATPENKYKIWTSGSTGFNWYNTPYVKNIPTATSYDNATFSKYGDGDTLMQLEMSDDAARYNLGEPWRMPTGGISGEFAKLYEACGGTGGGSPTNADVKVKVDYNGVSGLRGFLLTASGTNGTGKSLFIPAAGHCYYASTNPLYNNEVGSYARYLSSTLSTHVGTNGGSKNYHHLLYIDGKGLADGANAAGGSFWHQDIRARQMSVRPVMQLQEGISFDPLIEGETY